MTYVYYEFEPNHLPIVEYAYEEAGLTYYQFYPEYEEGYFEGISSVSFTYDGILYTYETNDFTIPPFTQDYRY